MSAEIELESIAQQIADLRELWSEAASAGRHSEALGIENEITALERSAARYEMQAKAEVTERKRQQAIEAVESARQQIEAHKVARAEMEAVVAEIEAATKVIDAAMERLRPAFTKCVASWPTYQEFKDQVQQEAYDEELGADRFPRFDALRLRLRLPIVLATLRRWGNGGLAEIEAAADARF